MTMITENAGLYRPRSQGVAEVIQRWIARAIEWRRIRKEMKALSKLPPAVLRDMGLERFAAPREPTMQNPWL